MPKPSPLSRLIDAATEQARRGDLAGCSRIITELSNRGVKSEKLLDLQVMFQDLQLQHAQDEMMKRPKDIDLRLELIRLQRAAHRQPETTQTMLEAIQQCPEAIIFRRMLAEHYLASRCFKQALETVELALELGLNDPDLLTMRAELLTRGQNAGACDAIHAAWASTPRLWKKFYGMFLRVGAFTDAETALISLLDSSPQTLEVQAAVSNIELLRSKPQQAISTGQALLDADSESYEGLFLRGAGRALAKQEGARHDLEQCLSITPPVDTWVERTAIHAWLSELALERCEFDLAVAQADLSMRTASYYSANAWLARYRAIGARTAATVKLLHRETNPRWHSVILNYGSHTSGGPKRWEKDMVRFWAMLDHIHAHTGGNRSSVTTWFSNDGGLEFIPPRDFRPKETRNFQHHLRALPCAQVIEEFIDLTDQFPNVPGTHTYTGETLVWIGDYKRSEEHFRKALKGEYETIWCWIGLGAARGMQGHLEEGLQIFEEGRQATNFEGPSVFVYRGEFHRRLGNTKESMADLNKAVQHKPQRLSAWINRVLLDSELGNHDPAALLATAVKETNPGLWSDALRHIKSTPAQQVEPHLVFEAILTLMRGNRSSQVLTYVLPDETLRFASWQPSDVPQKLRERYAP